MAVLPSSPRMRSLAFLLQGIVGKRGRNAYPFCAGVIRFLQEMNFGHTSRTGSSVAALGHTAEDAPCFVETGTGKKLRGPQRAARHAQLFPPMDIRPL